MKQEKLPSSIQMIEINKKFFKRNHFPIKGAIISKRFENTVIMFSRKGHHEDSLKKIITTSFLQNQTLNQPLLEIIKNKLPHQINGIDRPELTYAYYLAMHGELTILNGSSDSLNYKMERNWPTIELNLDTDFAGAILVSPKDITTLIESQKKGLEKYKEQLLFLNQINPIEVLLVPIEEQEEPEIISLETYLNQFERKKKGK